MTGSGSERLWSRPRDSAWRLSILAGRRAHAGLDYEWEVSAVVSGNALVQTETPSPLFVAG